MYSKISHALRRRQFMKIATAGTGAAVAGLAGGIAPAWSADKPAAKTVLKMVQSWPMTAKHAAVTMIDKYGPPAESTATRLIWFNNGPWKRTIVQKEEIDHAFPMPHKDVMEQAIDYQVPADKFDDLARFDGSVYVDRTRGELSARCDDEAANLLALNLAHDIVTGKRNVEEARQFYPKALMAHMEKQSSPYTEKLQFATKRRTEFRDETIVSDDMVKKAMKIKQAKVQSDLKKAGLAGDADGGSSVGR